MSSSNRIIRNIFHLSYSNYFSQSIRFLAFLFIVSNLSIDDYGKYIIIISFVEFFTFLTLPGMNKPILRDAARDVENIQSILNNKVGIRNFFGILAILACNISLHFTSFSSEIKFLILIFSSSLIINLAIVYLHIIFSANEVFHIIAYDNVLKSLIFAVSSFF